MIRYYYGLCRFPKEKCMYKGRGMKGEWICYKIRRWLCPVQYGVKDGKEEDT